MTVQEISKRINKTKRITNSQVKFLTDYFLNKDAKEFIDFLDNDIPKYYYLDMRTQIHKIKSAFKNKGASLVEACRVKHGDFCNGVKGTDELMVSLHHKSKSW